MTFSVANTSTSKEARPMPEGEIIPRTTSMPRKSQILLAVPGEDRETSRSIMLAISTEKQIKMS
jgi:hypothetical protein